MSRYRKWLIAGSTALGVLSIVVLAGHGVARPASVKTSSSCPAAKYQAGQPIVFVSVDGTESTQSGTLRSEYARAVSGIAAAASNQGAYLVVATFGATLGGIETLCATSTRIAGAAPLFVTARQTELRQTLDNIARRATRINTGGSGSSIFGALVDAIDRVQLLRNGVPVPAQVVVITDGDEAAGAGVHLRRLLYTRASDQAIAKQIVGKLPPPLARGLSIQIQGVGRLGVGRPISTQGVRRMQDIWARICSSTHADNCVVTSDLLGNLR